MNAADPSTLALRDIHLPAAVSWWPPAMGWWILAAVLLGGLIAAAWGAYSRRRLRLQRAALNELEQLEHRYATGGDAHAYARGLSRLARRLTIALDASARAATGNEWLLALQRVGGRELPGELVAVLLEAPYSPARADVIDPATYTHTASAMREWIQATGKRQPARPGHA